MSRQRLIGLLVGLILVLVISGIAIAIVLVGRAGEGAGTAAGDRAAVAPRGELRILGADPPTLDPALSSDAESATYIVEIFSGLVTYRVHDDYRMELVPDLAERWEISPDGRTYTFRLRQGATFHNGKPVTAADFKWSMERALSPRTLSTVADTYLGDIVGAKDMLRGAAREASGIQVVDDRTLRITIDEPKPYFLAKLTYPTAFVLDRENVESSRNWTLRPNGTGPFKLARYELGRQIVLEANPNFYNGPPKLERVTFLLTGGAAMTMYENNEIDITGVGLFDMDRVLDPTNPLNKELVRCPGATVGCPQYDIFYVAMNPTIPPFDDVKVRQAFAHAVNVEQITRVVLRDLVQPAKGILPPGFPGYNPNLQGLGFNPQRAQQLLQESKYGSAAGVQAAAGPRGIVLTMPGAGATPPGSVEAILEQWRTNLGIQVQVQLVEFATFLADVDRRRFPMYSLGWIADYIDPHDFLDILFHSGSQQNHMSYSNPEVDRLLEQARTERDEATRMRLYQQAEQLIVNDAVWIPLWHNKAYILAKPWVKGFKVPPFIVPVLKDVSVER